MIIPSDSNKRGLNSFVFNTTNTCANTKVYRGIQPKVFTEAGINSIQVSPTCNTRKGSSNHQDSIAQTSAELAQKSHISPQVGDYSCAQNGQHWVYVVEVKLHSANSLSIRHSFVC